LDQIVVNLYNKSSNYIEIHKLQLNPSNYSDIINYEMYQIDCIVKLNEDKNQKPYELHEYSQLTSLDNYLIIFDNPFVYYINITTNKIIIKQKLNFSLSKILNIEKTNDIVTFYDDINVDIDITSKNQKHKKASLFFVKLVQNPNSDVSELLVIEKIFYRKIDDIKLTKNLLIVLCEEKCVIEIYSIEHLSKNSLFESNPLVIKFNNLTNDFINMFELTPNCDYLSVLSEKQILYLVKISTSTVISVIPLQIYFKNLIASDKYVSIFSNNDGLLYSFIIIDHLQEDHLKRVEELKLNKSLM
jgi:hypothetical protein